MINIEDIDKRDVVDFRNGILAKCQGDMSSALERASELTILWLRRARAARNLPEWKPGDELWPVFRSDDESLEL